MNRLLVSLSTLLLAIPLQAAEPNPDDILDSLMYTVAIVEYCNIDVSSSKAAQIARTGLNLENNLGISREKSDNAYIAVKSYMAFSPPDCESEDMMKIRHSLEQQ